MKSRTIVALLLVGLVLGVLGGVLLGGLAIRLAEVFAREPAGSNSYFAVMMFLGMVCGVGGLAASAAIIDSRKT